MCKPIQCSTANTLFIFTSMLSVLLEMTCIGWHIIALLCCVMAMQKAS